MAKVTVPEGRHRATLIGLAVFPCLGGVAAGMVWGDLLVGVCAYYALLLLGLLSPKGAALYRGAKGRPSAGPLVSGLKADQTSSQPFRR